MEKDRCNRHDLERRIPLARRREVRQRCGFACVLCENFFTELHHFRPEYKDATEHDPDGITLLCGSCHDEATRGLVTPRHVAEADAARRISGPDARYQLRRTPIVVLGAAVLTGPDTLLKIHDEVVLAYHREVSGLMTLSASLRDANGDPAVNIEHNVVVFRRENWDVEAQGREVTVRSGPGNVWLRLRLWGHAIHIMRLRLQWGGWSIDTEEGGRFVVENMTGRGGLFLAKNTFSMFGSIELDTHGFRGNDGFALGGRLARDRLLALAERGELETIVTEAFLRYIVEVRPHARGWQVKRWLAAEELVVLGSRDEAIDHARRLLDDFNGRGSVLVTNPDGAIETFHDRLPSSPMLISVCEYAMVNRDGSHTVVRGGLTFWELQEIPSMIQFAVFSAAPTPISESPIHAALSIVSPGGDLLLQTHGETAPGQATAVMTYQVSMVVREFGRHKLVATLGAESAEVQLDVRQAGKGPSTEAESGASQDRRATMPQAAD